MKPRALKTYKILAVALTAAAGCTKAVGPDAIAEPAEPQKQEVPAPKPGEPTPPEVANAPTPPAPPSPPADRPTSDDPALLTLRDELRETRRDAALARVAHFRPLCDKDGYPLVGNVVLGKGETDKVQPSAFCAEIRQQARR